MIHNNGNSFHIIVNKKEEMSQGETSVQCFWESFSSFCGQQLSVEAPILGILS